MAKATAERTRGAVEPSGDADVVIASGNQGLRCGPGQYLCEPAEVCLGAARWRRVLGFASPPFCARDVRYKVHAEVIIAPACGTNQGPLKDRFLEGGARAFIGTNGPITTDFGATAKSVLEEAIKNERSVTAHELATAINRARLKRSYGVSEEPPRAWTEAASCVGDCDTPLLTKAHHR